MAAGMPVRFTAYDGSAAGPADAEIGLHLRTQRGLSYLMTAPGDLGMARAYVSGDLDIEGVHPGDPYDALLLLQDNLRFRRPSAAEAVSVLRSLGRHQPAATAPAAGGAPAAVAAHPRRAAPLDGPRRRRRSPTTTTSPTGSTSWCWGRR